MEVETKTITNPTDTLTDGVISTIVYEKEPEVTTGDLEVEMAKEPAKLPTIVTNLDICFMLDCTGSMQSYIDRSRNKIKDIIEEVKQQYPESEIQVGIVGYRDVQDTKRFEILPFTSNIHSAKDFLDAIRADGGGDAPEDVNGAFQETLNNMEWQGQAKMIVHIADAPCHGKDFHSCWSDNHPSGYKDDVAWEVLFKKIIDQRIDYLFLKIESETDKMFTKFKEIAEGLGATANGVLFKQEPISIADAIKTAPVVTVSTAPSLFTRVAYVEKKKRAPRKEAAKKEKKETIKTKKARETRSKSRKGSVSRSRSKSVKTTKKEKASRKKVEKEEEVSSDWNAPTHWTRSKYQEYLEHGGKEQKKDGYWSIPQTDATEIKTTRRRSSKKSTTRKPSVSKERSEKRDKKRTEKSTRRKASASKDKERSAERTKKKNSARSKSKKGGMAVEDTLPKRAFVAPKTKVLTKAPVMPMPTSFVGMSAMDEQEYFAKLLSKEMMESIHRKKDAVK